MVILEVQRGDKGVAEMVAPILTQADIAESRALGTTNIVESLQRGLDTSYCWVLVGATQGVLCLGGICPDTQSVWLVTTTNTEKLSRAERLKAILKLRGILKELLETYKGIKFSNMVGISNHGHIKLIKALGGKGFNTLLLNDSGSKFYPFHFIKE